MNLMAAIRSTTDTMVPLVDWSMAVDTMPTTEQAAKHAVHTQAIVRLIRWNSSDATMAGSSPSVE